MSIYFPLFNHLLFLFDFHEGFVSLHVINYIIGFTRDTATYIIVHYEGL